MERERRKVLQKWKRILFTYIPGKTVLIHKKVDKFFPVSGQEVMLSGINLFN